MRVKIALVAVVALLSCDSNVSSRKRDALGAKHTLSAEGESAKGSKNGPAAPEPSAGVTTSSTLKPIDPGTSAFVTPPLSAEPIQSPEDLDLGPNIALSALGGQVVLPVEPADRDPQWGTKNLIDGYPVIRGVANIPNSLGWMPASEVPTFPYELVFAFHGKRSATVAAVVIDTASNDNVSVAAGLPKEVEIWASTQSASDGFTQVATKTLPQAAGENVVRFNKVHAAYVKLVIRSSYDAGVRPQLGEVSIYEAGDAPSVVGDLPKNLLLPALGGSLVRFTTQDRDGEAYRLIDGVLDPRQGWSSGSGEGANRVQFPHELTFAFRDHRTATIDRVVISPQSGLVYGTPTANTTWPKTIEVQASITSPWDQFSTIQTVTLGTGGKPVTVPIGRAIRYLRLRILDNQGNERTTLGEVEAFEAKTGRSLTAGRGVPLLGTAPSEIASGRETASRREREPNDSIAEADPLLSPNPVGGALVPDRDRDVFVVPAAAKVGKQTVTVSVEGRPVIRSRISVVDKLGVTRYQLDPAKLAAPTARFSVVTDAGDVALQVVQPPAAQVMIWDSSGSMEQRVADLDAALRQYLTALTPQDRVQLIRFDDTIEVLLKDFSSDRNALVGALKDKVYANGGTSIYDAIGKGVDALAKIDGSRAMVLLTDGEDTTSEMDPSLFWRTLQRSNARLYAIGLGNGLRNFVTRAGATAERVLSDAAVETGGRYLFVADSKQLAAMYTQIGMELRAPATYAIAATATTGTGTIAVRSLGDPLAVPPRVELVLDASGSMKRKAGGGSISLRTPSTGVLRTPAEPGLSMMDAAKSVLTDVVSKLPPSAIVGLRVYGHRIPEGAPEACRDSELVVPFGALDRKALTATIKQVRALGTTPIAYSIEQVGDDLKDAAGPAMLILVTDGKEECGGDPVAAITALRQRGIDSPGVAPRQGRKGPSTPEPEVRKGIDVTLNIVGFSLGAAADRDAMARVAAAGSGQFFDAKNAADLKAAVFASLAVPYSVIDAAGAVVGRGKVGGPPVAVPAGELAIRLDTAATAVAIEHVVVEPSKATTVELNKDGDHVGANISAPGGAR